MQSMDADVIGLAAHNRAVNNQPGFKIVEDRLEEDTVTRMLKKVISDMTQFFPRDRLKAPDVSSKLVRVSIWDVA